MSKKVFDVQNFDKDEPILGTYTLFEQPVNDDGNIPAKFKTADLLAKDDEMVVEKLTVLEMWKSLPKSIFCIMGNELCERFSFYGMTTILLFYLVNVLQFDQNTAASVFRAFSMLASFTPIFGSILADGFIGKYHTILWVSLFYACGSVMMGIAASFKAGSSVHPYMDIAALIIICLGTGGIKPCVSPFGGDQFKKGQVQSLGLFFSLFYFTINVGALVSAIVSPLFRVLPCEGEDTCYPLAFGFPAILMVISVIIFAAGTPLYNRFPPQGALLVEVFKVSWIAVETKITSKEKRDYWLKYYMITHDCSTDKFCTEQHCHKILFINDVRSVYRILIMFVPIPFFWAIYGLQGDRWVFQAMNMNGKYGSFVILPDQMGAFNTLLILLFIPFFQSVVYPLFSKICNLTYLRKMSAGGFFAVAGCALCGCLQLVVNTTLPDLPKENTAFFTVLNYSPCPVTFNSINNSLVFQAPSMMPSAVQTVSSVTSSDESFEWLIEVECGGPNITFSTSLSNGMSTYAVLTSDLLGWNYANLEKSTQGEGDFKISVNYYAQNPDVMNTNGNVHFAWCTSNVQMTANDSKTCNCDKADEYTEFSATIAGESDFIELLPKSWYLYIKYNDGYYRNTNISYNQENQGGIYTLTVLNNSSNTFISKVYQIAPDNSISLFWQLPQYVVMTASEILLSITGLEFSFSQAPASMKSVIMAIWLLTNALGSVIVILIYQFPFTNMAYLFFFFAAMLFVVMFVFVLLAMFYYEYVDDKKR